MKKLLTALLAVSLLLAFPSCEKETPQDASSLADTASEAVSETVSVDPHAPLTDGEIDAFGAQFDLLNGTDCLLYTMKCKTVRTVSGVTGTDETTVLLGMKGKGNEAEVYREESVLFQELPLSRIIYFKDGRAYYITSYAGESEGYYTKCSYKDLFPSGETEEDLSQMRDFLTCGDVTRDESGITVTCGADDDLLSRTEQNFRSLGLLKDPDEGTSRELTDASLTVSFGADGKLASTVESLSFSAAADDTTDESVTLTVETAYASYGDGEMTVPVPENLDGYPDIEEYYENWESGSDNN